MRSFWDVASAIILSVVALAVIIVIVEYNRIDKKCFWMERGMKKNFAPLNKWVQLRLEVAKTMQEPHAGEIEAIAGEFQEKKKPWERAEALNRISKYTRDLCELPAEYADDEPGEENTESAATASNGARSGIPQCRIDLETAREDVAAFAEQFDLVSDQLEVMRETAIGKLTCRIFRVKKYPNIHGAFIGF